MTDDYQARLEHLRHYEGHSTGSLKMLKGMEVRARTDAGYKELLYDWLVNGDTLKLRDVLAEPFKHIHDMETMKGRLEHFNRWAYLDSIGMHSRDALAAEAQL